MRTLVLTVAVVTVVSGGCSDRGEVAVTEPRPRRQLRLASCKPRRSFMRSARPRPTKLATRFPVQRDCLKGYAQPRVSGDVNSTSLARVGWRVARSRGGVGWSGRAKRVISTWSSLPRHVRYEARQKLSMAQAGIRALGFVLSVR